MQVELTERYGLRTAHILATGAIPRLQKNALEMAFSRGYAVPDDVAMPAASGEQRFPPAGRGAEATQACTSHRRKLAAPSDVEAGPDVVLSANHRGLWPRSVEGIGIPPHAFASHPAARRSS